MSDINLKRVYELKDLVKDQCSPDAYFQNFEYSLQISCDKRKAFIALEKALQGLDEQSWNELKKDVAPLLMKRDKKRKWQSLFDRLNEAHGYNYLKYLNCTDIKFIPRSTKDGIQSPDIKGNLDGREVLCEVKTINVSDDELFARKNIQTRYETGELSDGIINKLISDTKYARKQLHSYRCSSSTRCIVYFVIKYDNFTGDFDNEYYEIIKKTLTCADFHDLEIVCHNEIQKNT